MTIDPQTRGQQQHVSVPDMPAGSYIALGTPTIPPEGDRFLALVLSPTYEVGMLAARTGDQLGAGSEQQYQYISADAALLVADALLSSFSLLLPHATPECMQSEANRIMRLRNAYQANVQTHRGPRRHEEATARTSEPEPRPDLPCGCDTALPATGSTRCRDCDALLGATGRPPGAGRNNPLAVTTAAEIQAQESPYGFTCTFPDMCIAIVQVYGAQSRDDARSAVQGCWRQCQYTVTDGDGGRSHVAPFTLMVKRHADLFRFEADQSQSERGETEICSKL